MYRRLSALLLLATLCGCSANGGLDDLMDPQSFGFPSTAPIPTLAEALQAPAPTALATAPVAEVEASPLPASSRTDTASAGPGAGAGAVDTVDPAGAGTDTNTAAEAAGPAEAAGAETPLFVDPLRMDEGALAQTPYDHETDPTIRAVTAMGAAPLGDLPETADGRRILPRAKAVPVISIASIRSGLEAEAATPDDAPMLQD